MKKLSYSSYKNRKKKILGDIVGKCCIQKGLRENDSGVRNFFLYAHFIDVVAENIYIRSKDVIIIEFQNYI